MKLINLITTVVRYIRNLDECGKRNLPKHELEALVREFLPDIKEFYENEDNRKRFEEWKCREDEKKKQCKEKRKTAQPQ